MSFLPLIFGVLVVLVAAAAAGARVVRQYERGVVYRFGRVRPRLLRPGLALLVPFVDRLQKVNMQIITLPVPAQEGSLATMSPFASMQLSTSA